MLHRRGMGIGNQERAFLLLCPNLTMVALGAQTLKETGNLPQNASWLLLTGLVMSVTALFLLPPTKVETSKEMPKPKSPEPAVAELPKKEAK